MSTLDNKIEKLMEELTLLELHKTSFNRINRTGRNRY